MVSIYRQWVVEVLNDNVHPIRKEMVELVAQHVSSGIEGIIFYSKHGTTASPERDAAVQRTLTGLKEGARDATAKVTAFIEYSGNCFNIGFSFFVRDCVKEDGPFTAAANTVSDEAAKVESRFERPRIQPRESDTVSGASAS